ncbi:MAG: helicase, partial [Microbacteriaceae bacterium]|nr:helicase [Microbacteriaceae bacterium]
MYLLGGEVTGNEATGSGAPGTVVYSATDLSAASSCEWALMRGLDARLGRIPKPPQLQDDMLDRAAVLGDAHELRMLNRLRAEGPVTEIDRPAPQHIAVAAAETAAAFAAGARVIFQAAFFDGRFLGYADFILKSEDGSYEVYDTKLARHAKVTALLQLAAYSEQLQLLGVPVGQKVYLLLGDDTTSEHRLQDILPVYRRRRARLEQIIDERVADTSPTPWGDPRYAACGRCDACEEQVQLHRDVLLVAGMRMTQRARLQQAGIGSIDQLARSSGAVDGISESTLAAMREQAILQVEEPAAGQPLAWRVANPRALAALPVPDAGDIFFDFEGDPLYQEG